MARIADRDGEIEQLSRVLHLAILHQLTQSNGNVQFLIATHSPIILAYPDAQILSFDSGRIEEVCYEDTEAYKITSGFLANRGAYLRHLFE